MNFRFPKGLLMIVSDAMTDYFASAHIRSTIGDVMEKMLSEGLDRLFIVNDSSKLVGNFQEPFLMEAIFDHRLQNEPVSSVMQQSFLKLGPDDQIERAFEKFIAHRTSEFPVVSDTGKLVGVLTRRQILRAILDRKQDPRKRIFAASVA